MGGIIEREIKIRKIVYYISDKEVYKARVVSIKKVKYEGVLGKEYNLRILKNKTAKDNGRPTQSELEFFLFEPDKSISALIRAPD